MHEKQILMKEWICMKCSHTSNVEGDHYFNSRSTCMSLLRHGCQRHSFLNSQTDSQMYTFPDQMRWQVVQILSKLRVLETDDVKQYKSLFSVQGKSAWYVFMVFCSFVLYVIVCVCYTKDFVYQCNASLNMSHIIGVLNCSLESKAYCKTHCCSWCKGWSAVPSPLERLSWRA